MNEVAYMQLGMAMGRGELESSPLPRIALSCLIPAPLSMTRKTSLPHPRLIPSNSIFYSFASQLLHFFFNKICFININILEITTKFISSPPYPNPRQGLKSHPNPAPPPMCGGKNLHETKRGGEGQNCHSHMQPLPQPSNPPSKVCCFQCALYSLKLDQHDWFAKH